MWARSSSRRTWPRSSGAELQDPLPFAKYHGLGNDYLVVDARPLGDGLDPEVARRLCDRSHGVGSDGVLLRCEGSGPSRFALRILNPDGSEAEKSGNGLRIFARWLFDHGEVGDEPFAVATPGGEVECCVLGAGAAVRVAMGRVTFRSDEIPVAGPPREVLREPIEVGGLHLEFSAASIGNPHCVVLREELRVEDTLRLGPLLENEPRFPNRTNVQLARPRDRHTLEIEIWERGTGRTLASGSSSCAAAAVAHRLGLCDAHLEVVMAGGRLAVEIDHNWNVVQTGPVTRVAEGRVFPEALADLS